MPPGDGYDALNGEIVQPSVILKDWQMNIRRCMAVTWPWCPDR